MSQCPICRRPLDRDAQAWLKCAACGEYQIDLRAAAVISRLESDDRRRSGLSAYVRAANKSGEVPLVGIMVWETQADSYMHAGVAAKLRSVLQVAGERTKQIGEPVLIYEALDYPLFSAQVSEVRYLVEALVSRGLLAKASAPQDALIVTPEGWEQLEPSGGGGIPGTCFVAMSFKDELNSAYDNGIHPAVTTDCGFDVIQLSRVEHSENINDKIIAEIRRAQFLVADFTFHAAGVYFEAGLGLGLGKLVIWTCRHDEFRVDKVHFDTRPYNHIIWSDEADLREKLKNRIRALVTNARHA
jgi:hypothetical protein